MPYSLYRFGSSILLPIGDSQDDLSTGEMEATQIDVAGGVFDAAGQEIVPIKLHTLEHRGIYKPGATTVEAQVDALKGYVGRRLQLWRKRQSDSAIQWKFARLRGVRHTRDKNQVDHAEVSARFDAEGYWKAETQSTLNRSSTGALAPNNVGSVYVWDAVITFTASGTGNKTVRVQNTTWGVDWTWGPASITDTQVLRIDTGALSVLNHGADAYNNLVFAAAHTNEHWLVIPPGGTSYNITLTGAGTIEFLWYSQWA